jgi:hypothetical protein
VSRSPAVGVPVRSSLVAEMASGELGDQRLNERRDRLVAVLEQHPDTGFPDACADDAEVEALYRFLRNPRVSWAKLIEPHVVATQARCAALGEVLVIHDTTDMVFRGEAPRVGLARLGKGRYGFWMHAALAVSADGLRAPLGVLSLVPFIRKMQLPGTHKNERARFEDPEKESRHWRDGVTATRTRLGRDTTAIHIMDRGADSYELYAALQARGERFVTRLHHDRRVRTDAGPATLHEALPRPPVLGQRQVPIAPRRVGNRPQQARQKHPAREGRLATLQFAARALTLARPHGSHYRALPPEIQLNVVYAWEPAVPAGEDAIEWQLITTEPIDTLAQVLQIVDWYRARWLIEEYFKALKTGCAYEQRQLESLATLLVALALLAPIAWQLLALRHLARAAPHGTARGLLSDRQLLLLRAAPAGAAFGRTVSIRDALMAVARLGGHLRQNGEPGWRVLGRGIQKLLLMEAGWAAAEHARCDQS